MSLSATDLTRCRAQLKEADAKWVGVERDTAIGRLTITRRWKVSPDRIEAAIEYLDTYGFTTGTGEGTLTTIVNPKAGDETFDGTFRSSKTFDGATSNAPGWVYQVLRLARAPVDTTALAALRHIKTQEEEIVRPFGFTSGTKWDQAFIFYDLNPESKTVVEGFVAATLATALAGAGWTYVDRKWQHDAEGNTATFAVLVQKVSWTSTWASNNRIVAEQNPNDAEEVTKTVEATGISEANLATQYAAAKTVAPLAGHVIESASQSEQADGERVVRVVQGAVNEKNEGDPTADDVLTIHLTPEIKTNSATATRRWKRVSKAYKNALVAAGGLARVKFLCPETGTTTYTHSSVTITDHGNSVYTVTQSGFNSALLGDPVIDVYQDIYGDGVFRTIASSATDPSPIVYVRYPKYRSYHLFAQTWNAAWDACKAKSDVGKIMGEIEIGSFSNGLYHGRVRVDLGWTAWALVVTAT